MPAPAPVEPALPIWLELINIALLVAGLLLLAYGAARVVRHRRLWSVACERRNNLTPEYIFIPLICFLLLVLVADGVVMLLPQALLNEEGTRLLTNMITLLLGGVVCVLLASRTFHEGARGFLFGEDSRIAADIGWGLAGLLAVLPLCWLASEASVRIIEVFRPDYELPAHQVLEYLEHEETPSWMVPLLWLSALAVAPFAEEAFFRGICQTGLNHMFKSRWVSVVFVSAVFGFAHNSQPHAVAPLMVLGLSLGFVYERSGSLLAPFVLHVLFNLKTLVYFSFSQG